LALLSEPATSQRQARQQVPDKPQLRLPRLGFKSIEGDDDAPLLLRRLPQTVVLLTLMAG
jgi:hypothetical protein